MSILKHKIWSYKISFVCLRIRTGPISDRQGYGTHVVAETTGPYTDIGPIIVIGRNIPGTISKLANKLRHGNIGRLHPDGPRPDAIMGLNKWWGDNNATENH